MKRLVTLSLILGRVDYSDSDRILSLLTPDYGKRSVIAKGARKLKSKLAGGIEPFCLSEIIFVEGRGELGTLVSARGKQYYSNIATNLDRLQCGYKIIKLIDINTKEHADSEYFWLLENSLKYLNDLNIDADLVLDYFFANLINISGLTPNLDVDQNGSSLEKGKLYNFDFNEMCFLLNDRGKYDTNIIKILRILFSSNPEKIFNIKGVEKYQNMLTSVLETMLKSHLSV